MVDTSVLAYVRHVSSNALVYVDDGQFGYSAYQKDTTEINTMNIPGFTADASLYSLNGCYRRDQFSNSYAGAVVPAIPFCGNCDQILDNCFKHGWPRRRIALCDDCFFGICSDVPPGQG